MNILDLPIGSKCRNPATGTKFEIVCDSVEKRPGLGLVTVRIAFDPAGKIHKFIRGVEVEPI